ncbi:MAG TPA: class I SAM-dependent methyltransferase [Longimicrobiales bacterium]
MSDEQRTYIPAAGRHWGLPFYDLLAKLLGADRARARLVEGVSSAPGERILEIGCGTGSMLLLLKRAQPDAEVVGLDPDPKALSIARRKATGAGVEIRLDRGYADALPYDEGTFDHVVSSFMFHHLSSSEKEDALSEVRRVLRPGGRFHLLDFDGMGAGGHGIVARRIHASRRLEDNGEERVLRFLGSAGLVEASVAGRVTTRFARMVWFRAAAPDADTRIHATPVG